MLRNLFIRFFYLATCFSTFVAPSVNYEIDNSRIMNGKVATDGQFPFAVSLQQNYPENGRRHVCSISLITSKTCLGAAHCILRKNDVLGATNFCGIVGFSYQGPDSECHDLASIYPHEEYNNVATINDIALFIFINAVGDYAKTIKIAGPSIPIADQEVTVLGWGIMNSGGDIPDRLQYTFMHVTAPSECENVLNGHLLEGQICISEQNTGSCVGDSGGPIVLTDSNLQIAIVSFGKTDCDTLPFVATDVRKFTEWIKEHAEGEPEIEG